MRKIWIPLIVIALIGSAVYAKLSVFSETPEKGNVTAANGIKFIDEDWKLALKKAASEKKYIFVDAYASWCGPCRRTNPVLVSVYNKYKDARFSGGEKGFTIYSVSLDAPNGKTKW